MVTMNVSENVIDSKSKKRKVSKKTKSSWRKHIDTKDVDSFLENSRLEERLGVPFSQRKDSELFTVDTVSSKPDNNVEATDNIKARRERYRISLQSGEARCFASLKPHTLVPDPITKRNRVRAREERKHPILRRKEVLRKANNILTLTEKLALKNKELAEKKRQSKPKRGEYHDIWKKDKTTLGIDSEWLSPAAVRHTLSQLGQKKKHLPSSIKKKPSELPVVVPPHPGSSYNPSYEDHQNLLSEVAQKELELMKQEEHLNRVTTKMFHKVSVNEKDKNTLKELSEGLPLPNVNNKEVNKEEEKEELEGDKFTAVKAPLKNVKKSKAMRRKQKEQKELAHQRKKEKLEKKKVSDIYKLTMIQKQLQVREKKQEILRERRQKLKTAKAKGTKTLAKVKFEPLEPEFKLAEELTGNLRSLSSSTNLLKDRYKSLQERNIVAPAKLVLKRNKAKVKKFIKPDHKIHISTEIKK